MENIVEVLYTVELIGSIILCTHALLLFVMADLIKSLSIAQFLVKFTKLILGVYLLFIIFRIILYLKIHADIVLIDHDHDLGFGSFLAAFIDDKTGALVLSIVLILLFGACLFINIWSIRVIKNL